MKTTVKDEILQIALEFQAVAIAKRTTEKRYEQLKAQLLGFLGDDLMLNVCDQVEVVKNQTCARIYDSEKLEAHLGANVDSFKRDSIRTSIQVISRMAS